MKKIHERWLDKADDDLNFARLGFKNKYYAQVCFLSQQCIEKCLKGFIVFKGRLYDKTHNLMKLYEDANELKSKLAHLEEKLHIIDEYYVPVRYPDGVPGNAQDGEPSRENASEAMETAEKIFSIVAEACRKKSR